MDPDRWFSSNSELKHRFQDELQACNNTSTIKFFSVLFVVATEMSAIKRYEVAIDYMEKRIPISSTWKSAFQKVSKEFRSAECHYQTQPTEVAKERLEKAEQAFRKEIDVFDEQSKKLAADLLAESTSSELEKRISTDYDFQILADDSVEKVFGRVFARLIRRVKSKKPFKVPGEENLSASNVSHTTHSSGRLASGGAQNNGNESGNTADNDGDNVLGNLFDD